VRRRRKRLRHFHLPPPHPLPPGSAVKKRLSRHRIVTAFPLRPKTRKIPATNVVASEVIRELNHVQRVGLGWECSGSGVECSIHRFTALQHLHSNHHPFSSGGYGVWCSPHHSDLTMSCADTPALSSSTPPLCHHLSPPLPPDLHIPIYLVILHWLKPILTRRQQSDPMIATSHRYANEKRRSLTCLMSSYAPLHIIFYHIHRKNNPPITRLAQNDS
jgi:hypothetical protein